MRVITVIDPLGAGRRAYRLGARAERAARDAAEETLLAVLDRVAQRAIQAGLVQHVVDELLAAGVVDQVGERLLAGPELDQLTTRVLESARAEQLVGQVLGSPLLDATVTRVLASRELWLVVEEIAQSPAVTEAISHQGAGFADQVAGDVGEGTRRADAWLERTARRMLHRTPRAQSPAPLVP